MSDAKTSDHFHGQDEYHRTYFHDIDAPAPLDENRVDPNLPTLEREKVVDPDLPEAPTRSGREEDSEPKAEESKAEEPKSGSRSRSTKTADK